MIHYIKEGDIFSIEEVTSYAHGCNCAGSMGRGIVVISLMTPILFLRIILTTLAVICMLMRFLYSSLILKSKSAKKRLDKIWEGYQEDRRECYGDNPNDCQI